MGSVSRGSSGPTAIHTKLGWMPSFHIEPKECGVNLSITHVLHVETVSEDALEEQLQAFWDLDEKRTLYNEFSGVVKFENGRYKVPLP